MPFLNENVLTSFRGELNKQAAPNWHSLVGGAAGGAGLGALVGGVGGGVVGAVRGAKKAHEKGESAIGGGLSGALHGAGKGIGLGAVAGGALGVAKPGALTAMAQSNHIGGSAIRFGQRQLHGVSGWIPKAGIEALRDMPTGTGKSLATAQASHAMGLTSIPGYVKAIKEHGIGKVLKTDLSSQWHSGGVGTKALAFGLPAAELGMNALQKENKKGPGKGEVIGRSMGGVAGGLLGSSMPLAGQLATGAVLSRVGGLAGRGIDRLRGRKSNEPGLVPPEQQQGQHVPTERTMSPAAMGQAPEGLMI